MFQTNTSCKTNGCKYDNVSAIMTTNRISLEALALHEDHIISIVESQYSKRNWALPDEGAIILYNGTTSSGVDASLKNIQATKVVEFGTDHEVGLVHVLTEPFKEKMGRFVPSYQMCNGKTIEKQYLDTLLVTHPEEVDKVAMGMAIDYARSKNLEAKKLPVTFITDKQGCCDYKGGVILAKF